MFNTCVSNHFKYSVLTDMPLSLQLALQIALLLSEKCQRKL